MSDGPRRRISGRLVCLIAAIICFVLAAFGVKVAGINTVYLGLAFWVSASVF